MLFRLVTLLIIGALGVITWFLSSPDRTPNREAATSGNEMPGYYLKNTILTDYDESGMPSLRIAADRIDQIDHGSEVVLFGVHVDYQPPTGQAWVLTGDVAHVAPGGGAIDVTGNVRLQGQAEGRAGFLVGIGGFQRRQDGGQVTLKERTLLLQSRVNGRFHP